MSIKHRVHAPGLIHVSVNDQVVVMLSRTSALVPGASKPYRALEVGGDTTLKNAIKKLDYAGYKELLAKVKALVAKYEARLAKKAAK